MSDIRNEWKELRHKIGIFICRMEEMNVYVDAKLKEQQVDLQAQIDEAYNKGLEDARNAALQLYENENWYEIFGSFYNFNILKNHSMAEIIEKENQLKAEKEKQAKEQELHVGDEILVINSDTKLNNRTFVIYEIDDYHYYVIEPITFYKDGFYKSAYDKKQLKKTGKHYDSIPLSKEENK